MSGAARRTASGAVCGAAIGAVRGAGTGAARGAGRAGALGAAGGCGALAGRGRAGGSGVVGAGARKRRRVDVAEAVAVAADAEVQARVCGAGGEGAEAGPAGDGRSRAYGDRREREVGHSPAAAEQGDDAAARADPARHDDAAGAGCADGRARRGAEVDPPVLAGRERVGVTANGRASRRPPAGATRCRRRGEQREHERAIAGSGGHGGHRTDGCAESPGIAQKWNEVVSGLVQSAAEALQVRGATRPRG